MAEDRHRHGNDVVTDREREVLPDQAAGPLEVSMA